jgi:hypothetical protein
MRSAIRALGARFASAFRTPIPSPERWRWRWRTSAECSAVQCYGHVPTIIAPRLRREYRYRLVLYRVPEATQTQTMPRLRVPRSGSLRRYSAPPPSPPPSPGRFSRWLQTFQLSDLPASRSHRSSFLSVHSVPGTYTTTIVVPRAPGPTPTDPTDRPTDRPTEIPRFLTPRDPPGSNRIASGRLTMALVIHIVAQPQALRALPACIRCGLCGLFPPFQGLPQGDQGGSGGSGGLVRFGSSSSRCPPVRRCQTPTIVLRLSVLRREQWRKRLCYGVTIGQYDASRPRKAEAAWRP